MWAHFTVTGYFPTNIGLSRPIPKESVRIEAKCCIFKRMIIDWTNTEVTGISGIRIEMPSEAKISIFTDNDLTHITDDHFEIKLIARLLDQIYVVQSPPPMCGMATGFTNLYCFGCIVDFVVLLVSICI